mmetsp:Transcript_10428/g.14739  ORF Transcript_10428/g.14739 Transcript_10428/m.14739 type:complete len:504 (+) Transcript_10428:193-1704(+)
MNHLINLFHGGFLIVIVAIKWRQVFHIIIFFVVIIVINGETKLDKTVNTRSKGGRFFQGESTGEERGIVKEPDQILDSLITLVSISLFAKGNNDRVGRVDFQSLLGAHVSRLSAVTESLCLHDTFHVGRPSEFTSDKTARRFSKTVRDGDLFNLVIKDFLHEFAKTFSLRLGFFVFGLFFFVISEVKSFLGGSKQLLSFELLQLLDTVLINWICHEETFVSLLLKLLKERRGFDGLLGFSSDVVNSGLLVVHAADVVIERSHLVATLGRVVTQELSKFSTIGGILVDTEFEVLSEGFVKLIVRIFVLSKVVKHLNALLDKVLLDDTKNLVLLKSLTRNVKRKILRVHNTLNELEPFGHDIFAVVHNEDTTDVKLDVVPLFLVSTLEHIKRSTLGAEEDGLEFKLTLNGEMLDRSVFFPIVRNGLVKGNVFILSNIISLTHPDGLQVVQVLPFVADLLDLLGLLLLLSLFLVINFFDLWLVIIIFVLVVIIIVSDFLLSGLLSV